MRIVTIAVVGVALSAGTGVVQAKPYEHIRFDEQGRSVETDFCGDLSVRDEFHDRGIIVGPTTGADRLPRYTEAHHGGSSITNLATGRAFTVTWNYNNQEVKVTDNGDGTISILTQVPGPEKTYGPDGKLVFTSGGTSDT